MADPRNTNPQSETTDQPNRARTGTPSNVPQTAGPASQDGPSRDEVSRRAYELFQKRGGQHGYHMEDWHEAERQLRTERQRPSGGSSAAKTTAKKSAAKKATAKKSTAKKSAAKKSAAKKTGGAG